RRRQQAPRISRPGGDDQPAWSRPDRGVERADLPVPGVRPEARKGAWRAVGRDGSERRGVGMRRFHHVGIITDQVQSGEIYVAQTRVHVTNPADHPYRVEYLRFEPDSPVTGPVRDQPHMAFAVDDLEAEISGEQILLGPFRAMEGLRVAFILRDGAVFEFMQFDGTSAFDPR